MRMIRNRFVHISVMIVGLVLLYSPAPLFAAAAYYGKDGTTCGPHMVNLQAPPTNGMMVLCATDSGATSWYAEVKRSDGQQMCIYGDVEHPMPVTSPQQFPCAIPTSNPQKLYRGYVHWVVGGSSTMNHTDQYFKK